MFYKELSNGKYRYYQKYYDETIRDWRQVSTTLNSKSRRAQAEARRILDEKIEVAQDTLFGVSENLTVSEVLPEWLKIRQSELKESTFYHQRKFIRTFEKVFGKYQVSKVTNMMLQNYLLSHKKWSKSYMVLNKTVIGIFFDYCVKIGYISSNPIKKVVLPKQTKTLSELKKKREKFLNRDQMKAYLEYLRFHGTHDVFNKIVEVMYLTGLRSGEALGLTWDVIDFEGKTIEIKQTLQSKGRDGFYLSTPKTLSGYRILTINSRVVEILKELKMTSKSDFVFVTRTNRPHYLHSLNYYLDRTFKESGIKKEEGFKLTSHVLRHSHISLLVELNIPIRVIMDRVGHNDEKTTIQIYTHVTKTMKDNVVSELENLGI